MSANALLLIQLGLSIVQQFAQTAKEFDALIEQVKEGKEITDEQINDMKEIDQAVADWNASVTGKARKLVESMKAS